MAKTNKIVYVTLEQYASLVTNGSVEVGGVTYTYDANNTYMVQENGLEGRLVQSTGASNGQVLTANGNGGARWRTMSHTPEGTAVKSTGVTSGKVLTANGSGGASWQDAGGGGSGDVTASGTLSTGAVILGLGNKTVTSSSGTNGKFLGWNGGATWQGLYLHTIYVKRTQSPNTPVEMYFSVISTQSSAYTSMSNVPNGMYVASGNIDQTAFSEGQCRILCYKRTNDTIYYWKSSDNTLSST
jgi:hypothetical protein